jgi:hypothetical protein
MLITTSVYIGSSIYSPAIVDGAEYFGVSQVVSILGLSLFGMSPSALLTLADHQWWDMVSAHYS